MFYKQYSLATFLATIFLFAAYHSHAEIITLPLFSPLEDSAVIDRPDQGMSEAQVLNTFGLDEVILTPVGQPAISRWVFPEFTVYFESGQVLHSVLKQTTPY